jgi:hypothetical protein
MMDINTPATATQVLYVQYGGFKKCDGAHEFASLMHKLLAREVATIRDGNTTEQQHQQQQQPYSIYLIRDNTAGCFMCAGLGESPSFHVTALVRCAYDTYFPTIHYRLREAVINDGICTRAKQCCGYVVRLIPAIIHRAMSDAWRESLIVPLSEAPVRDECFAGIL